MRALSIIPVFNEMTFLPLQIAHLQWHGIDAFFIDNESNDGTWEWLNDNQIPCVQFSTNGSFDLEALQRKRISVAHELRPDWVIYGDCDEFFVCDRMLGECLHELENTDVALLRTKSFELLNTGEEFGTYRPLWTHELGHYRYQPDGLVRIHRYAERFYYGGDSVNVPNGRIFDVPVINLNYGPTKPTRERDETLARARKAWDGGMNRALGAQYAELKRSEWVTKKVFCNSILDQPFAEQFLALRDAIDPRHGQ